MHDGVFGAQASPVAAVPWQVLAQVISISLNAPLPQNEYGVQRPEKSLSKSTLKSCYRLTFDPMQEANRVRVADYGYSDRIILVNTLEQLRDYRLSNNHGSGQGASQKIQNSPVSLQDRCREGRGC